jgi:hypothetical protein
MHKPDLDMTLKLLALDEEDLNVVSAHLQDAVFKAGDLDYSPQTKQFIVAMNRFCWEEAEDKAKSFERRRTALAFKQVKSVRSIGFDRKASDKVLSLLAVVFDKNGDGPDGFIELMLAEGASILLNVDCIEVQLADTGAAWETTMRPRHPGVV